MRLWTQDTTEGFTDEELELLDEAQESLEEESPGVDPRNIADALGAAWKTGATFDDLMEAF